MAPPSAAVLAERLLALPAAQLDAAIGGRSLRLRSRDAAAAALSEQVRSVTLLLFAEELPCDVGTLHREILLREGAGASAEADGVLLRMRRPHLECDWTDLYFALRMRAWRWAMGRALAAGLADRRPDMVIDLVTHHQDEQLPPEDLSPADTRKLVAGAALAACRTDGKMCQSTLQFLQMTRAQTEAACALLRHAGTGGVASSAALEEVYRTAFRLNADAREPWSEEFLVSLSMVTRDAVPHLPMKSLDLLPRFPPDACGTHFLQIRGLVEELLEHHGMGRWRRGPPLQVEHIARLMYLVYEYQIDYVRPESLSRPVASLMATLWDRFPSGDLPSCRWVRYRWPRAMSVLKEHFYAYIGRVVLQPLAAAGEEEDPPQRPRWHTDIGVARMLADMADSRAGMASVRSLLGLAAGAGSGEVHSAVERLSRAVREVAAGVGMDPDAAHADVLARSPSLALAVRHLPPAPGAGPEEFARRVAAGPGVEYLAAAASFQQQRQG